MKNKISILCILVIFVCGLGGCEPLRKKFTRKKTETKKQEFIPVLQPVDYPEQYEDPGEKYQHHHSLSRVWYKDLMTAYEDDASDKRLIYILNQMIVQMEEMERLLTRNKQAEMREWVDTARSIAEQLEVPAAVRSHFKIKNDLKALGKAITDKFSYENVEEMIRPAGAAPQAKQ